ncbi:MAG: cation-translocating P-type ATPase, partial [Spirulinaceae cyanobacterium]
FKDTIAIMVIVILNGALGYFQESRAEKALAALKNLSSPQVRVIRDGEPAEIEGSQVVPGDIILVESGTQLAADGQLIEVSNLQVRESALTGEAKAVKKLPGEVGLEEDTPLGDRRSMVFTGTEVIQGRAKVVVTATGMATELGKIAQMLQGVESEPTPLQQRMNQLSKALVTGSLSLVVLVIAIGVISTGNFSRLRELVEVSLSMAVAVVPEGLPAVVTVTLALGTQRMVRRHALIRKLPAVETLGSVSAICSDKTGTLTQNKMVVQEVVTLEDSFKVTGEGYNPTGDFLKEEQTVKSQDYPELQTLLLAGVLCNDAFLQYKEVEDVEGENRNRHPEWIILGDPTEGALLSLAGKASLEQQSLSRQLVRMGEFPFTSTRKRMSVICQGRGEAIQGAINTSDFVPSAPFVMFSKGSPELILERCGSFKSGNRFIPLQEEHRQKIIDDNDRMAQRGLRVLGLAYKSVEEIPSADGEESAEQELIWLGLVGMLDAPRLEAKEAVRQSKKAGIRTLMITGDHQLTAKAIASQLDIATEEDRVLSGRELQRMPQSELEQEVNEVSVYARVSPEHKLRIVQALQKQGQFVAMTGDGVNDAPALKQADIGIAMGITGTDVSKEASDMVLLDDNFTTIIAATEEGRVVYANIRRFIKYILGSNIGEVITIAAAPLIGLEEVPLVPLQILWMNLVTDGLPALALAVEPAEPNVMSRPPIDPSESIFARGLGSYMIRTGIIFGLVTIVLMWIAYNYYPDHWKTMVFTTLCIAQMGHAIAVRSHSQLTIELNPFSNPYLLVAVIGTTILQLMLVYIPVLQNFFGTDYLTLEELGLCFGFSAIIFVWVELEKLFVRWFFTKK